MRDQVAAAGKAGLKAESVNSTNIDNWDPIFAALENNQLDVLLVSPERLGNPAFATRLPRLLAQTSLIVIDEAHCISDWGLDFRPDYQRLAPRSELLPDCEQQPSFSTGLSCVGGASTDAPNDAARNPDHVVTVMSLQTGFLATPFWQRPRAPESETFDDAGSNFSFVISASGLTVMS